MFPMAFTLLVVAALLCSAAASAFTLVGFGTIAVAWGVSFVVLFGLLLVLNGQGGVRRAGVALLVAVTLGLGFVFGMHPALAHEAIDLVWRGGLASDLFSPVADGTPLILAPAGDTGLWANLNGYLADGLAAAVTALVGWGVKAFVTRTKIKIRADQEAQIRETMLTGAYAGMHDLELYIDDHWTPAQRQKVIDKMVVWVEQRASTQLKKIGLPNFVITAMARKVLGQLQGFGIGSDSLDALTGSAMTFTGSPGETPALDRAVGGNGGA